MAHMIDIHNALKWLCKGHKKWGMYISIYSPEDLPLNVGYAEIIKAAPYLEKAIKCLKSENKNINGVQILFDEQGYILFDTEKEMHHYYNLTVGDDGPTKLNNYKGRVKIYALTCDPNGKFLTENT